MNLLTITLLLAAVVTTLAEDPPTNHTLNVEDSLDFVDDDGASLVAKGVTEATIITATPTIERLPNSSIANVLKADSSRTVTSTTNTSVSSTNTSTTSSSTRTVITTTVPTTTVITTSVPTTTVPITTVPTTTVLTTTTAQPSKEEVFLTLLAENKVALTESEVLANTVKAEASDISSNLAKEVASLVLIHGIEKLLWNVTGALALSEADLLQSLVHSIYKVDYLGNRTINTLSYLLKYRELFRERVNNFSNKLSGMQEQILRSSKGLDDKLKLVNQILKQYIEPRVKNLKESFSNINASQVNSEAELKNLPEVQNLTETSNIKLTSLTNQLAILNHAKDNSLLYLGEAVNGLELANLKTINDLLQSISISQKRIDLGISVCENRPSEYIPKSYATYSENYRNEYVSNGSEELIGSPIVESKNCSCKANTYEELSGQSWNIKAMA